MVFMTVISILTGALVGYLITLDPGNMGFWVVGVLVIIGVSVLKL